MKSSVRLFIGLLTAFIVASSVFGSAVAMSGSGTSSDPYVVWDDTDLKALGTNIGTYANTYIELGADITCSGNQTVIGTRSTPFVGHFDGKNHTIYNLNVSGSSYLGLFGYCSGGFSIKNLKLVNGHVTGSNYIGMLIGCVQGGNGAVVENIETDGCKVDSNTIAGGIAGDGAYINGGSMTYRNCYVHDGYVVGSNTTVGGIVGRGASASATKEIRYENCRVVNEYVMASSDLVGGIVSQGADTSNNVTYSGCEVRDCVVKTSRNTVGGIAGRGAYTCSANYTNCGVYNTMVWGGKSSGDVYVGGICGFSYGGSSSTKGIISITNPIVDGCTITAPSGSMVGGVFGGSNESSYNTLTIQNPTVRNCSIIGNGTTVGGVVGSR